MFELVGQQQTASSESTNQERKRMATHNQLARRFVQVLIVFAVLLATPGVAEAATGCYNPAKLKFDYARTGGWRDYRGETVTITLPPSENGTHGDFQLRALFDFDHDGDVDAESNWLPCDRRTGCGWNISTGQSNQAVRYEYELGPDRSRITYVGMVELCSTWK